MLKVWGRANSVNVQKVLWLLTDLGRDYEQIDVGGSHGFPSDYREKNPAQLIPVVQTDTCILRESNTILRYIAADHGATDYYPDDLAARADVEAWMDWQLATMAAAFPVVYKSLIRENRDRSGEPAFDKAVQSLTAAFTILDDHLERRRFLAGHSVSLADIAVGVYAYRWLKLPMDRPDLSSLEAWHDRLEAKPGFSKHVQVPLT